MRLAVALALAAAVSSAPLGAKLTPEQRIELVRSLTAEFGVAKALIPRSKKPLDLRPDGKIDAEQWGEAYNKFGPAARLGDMVQITKVEIKGKRLIFQINYGIKGGRKWWHRVEVGGTMQRTTLGQNQVTHAPGGTTLALLFDKGIPQKEPKEFLGMLAPVLDFTQRSASELYLEKLDPKFREAIEKNEVVVGMDKDMVLMAKNRPDRKVRDFKDGVETEDWIYGKPPGDILFVTFEDGEVVRVKHAYANPGGRVSENKPVERD